MALIYGAALLFLLAVLVFAYLDPDMKMDTLFKDPAATHNASRLLGIVSIAGLLIWGVTVSVCIFAHQVCAKMGSSDSKRRFLLSSGVLTLLLLADDWLMLHERMPGLSSAAADIAEKFVLAGYLIIFLLYIARFRKILLQRDAVLFWLTFALFAASAGIDVVSETIVMNYSATLLLEDCIKFLGIVTWSSFLIHRSFSSVVPAVRSAPAQLD